MKRKKNKKIGIYYKCFHFDFIFFVDAAFRKYTKNDMMVQNSVCHKPTLLFHEYVDHKIQLLFLKKDLSNDRVVLIGMFFRNGNYFYQIYALPLIYFLIKVP